MPTADVQTIDALLDLRPGDLVTLRCRTSEANIYYKRNPEFYEPYPERVYVVPNESQLRAIPYTLSGIVAGVEYGKVNYLVLTSAGRTMHVPLTAVWRVVNH